MAPPGLLEGTYALHRKDGEIFHGGLGEGLVLGNWDGAMSGSERHL